ncbi:MAG: TIGR02206 family membrane protein [Phycisphaerae bacterium]|nr:TIGR02206 family membrane protein [Phycisphaerae bacterium]MDW8261340.1 TIGR02206 family membrane protein [Phycisphaerales bacterium]
MQEFHPFSLMHAMVLAAIAGIAVILCLVRRVEGVVQRRLDRGFAVVLLLVAIFCHGSRLLTEPFDGVRSLPLHLCHLSSWLAPVAIATSWWPARTLLYFWGLILGSQALITPVLEEGPAQLEFWRFWVGHGAIAAASVYDLAARGFRPGLRAASFAIVASLVYVAAVLPINLYSGANYGFVGPSLPARPSILDWLGPWPLRLLWVGLLATVVIVLAAAPWAAAEKRHSRSGADPAAGG